MLVTHSCRTSTCQTDFARRNRGRFPGVTCSLRRLALLRSTYHTVSSEASSMSIDCAPTEHIHGLRDRPDSLAVRVFVVAYYKSVRFANPSFSDRTRTDELLPAANDQVESVK